MRMIEIRARAAASLPVLQCNGLARVVAQEIVAVEPSIRLSYQFHARQR